MDYEYSNLPLGLAMANLLDDRIRTDSGPLTEAKKEEMIFRYKDADNEAEKERIRNAVAPEDNINDVLGGPSIG